MFITRISVHDYRDNTLFDAVLRELPDLCDSFVCYPSNKVFICQSRKNAGVDYEDILRWKKINVDHIVFDLIP